MSHEISEFSSIKMDLNVYYIAFKICSLTVKHHMKYIRFIHEQQKKLTWNLAKKKKLYIEFSVNHRCTVSKRFSSLNKGIDMPNSNFGRNGSIHIVVTLRFRHFQINKWNKLWFTAIWNCILLVNKTLCACHHAPIHIINRQEIEYLLRPVRIDFTRQQNIGGGGGIQNELVNVNFSTWWNKIRHVLAWKKENILKSSYFHYR